MLNHRNNSTGILINLSWSSLQAFLEPSRVARILKINYLRSQKIVKPALPTTNPRSRAKTAVIRVYNLSASTQGTIKKEFQGVMLQAGYENGAYGIIFFRHDKEDQDRARKRDRHLP